MISFTSLPIIFSYAWYYFISLPIMFSYAWYYFKHYCSFTLFYSYQYCNVIYWILHFTSTWFAYYIHIIVFCSILFCWRMQYAYHISVMSYNLLVTKLRFTYYIIILFCSFHILLNVMVVQNMTTRLHSIVLSIALWWNNIYMCSKFTFFLMCSTTHYNIKESALYTTCYCINQ